MAKKKRSKKHDPAWAKAKKLCRLNMEDIRKAKESGLNPKTLIKNVPGPNQLWKAPVNQWIRELYEKKQLQAAKKKQARKATRE